MKLDLGAGQRPTQGYKSVDLNGEADFTVDLFKPDWPFQDRSVTDVVANHLIEHIPHDVPECPGKDGWFVFWDEVWRICKRNAKITVTCPYVRNDRAFWDPTHTRYVHEMSFYYLNREWREAQALDHYPVVCNFEVVTISAGTSDAFAGRHHEAQAFANAHYWNAIGDLVVELKALK